MEREELGHLATILRGGSPRPIIEYLTNESSGLNWLKIADVSKDSKYVVSTKERVSTTALSKTREVNPGDLIMSNSMSFGRPYILKIKSCIHDGWIAITDIDKKLDRDYLYYFILSPTSQAYFSNNAAGSGVKNLNADIIKLLLVSFPDFIEQQKIAACLSSVDDLIAAQTTKMESLKAHKRGLIQQLFPVEGKNLPKLRFPEFRDAGEWEIKPLGEVMQITSSKRVHQSDWAKEGVPFYRAREIVALNKGEPITPLFISEELYLSNIGLSGGIEPGHLLITGVGSIGVPYLVKDKDRFYFKDGNIIWLKNDINVLLGDFLYLLYGSEFVQNQISIMTDIGTVETYTIDNAKNTLVIFPRDKDKKEQKKIADCLSSINEIITLESEKLDFLKTQKKGLMQQLFPSLDKEQI